MLQKIDTLMSSVSLARHVDICQETYYLFYWTLTIAVCCVFSYVYIRMLSSLTEIIEVHLQRFLLNLMVVVTPILVVTGVLYDT